MTTFCKQLTIFLLFLCLNGCASKEVNVIGRWNIDKRQLKVIADKLNGPSFVDPSKSILVLVVTKNDAIFLGTPVQWTYDNDGINLITNQRYWTADPLKLIQNRNGNNVIRISIIDNDTMIVEDSQGREFYVLKREIK